MSERITCCIDGCARSMKNPAGYFAWLCPKHWKTTDLALRAEHRAARRAWKAALRRMRLARRRAADDAADHAPDRRAAGDQMRAAWDALVGDATIKAAFGGEA